MNGKLVLEDGITFIGETFGSLGEVMGEVVFNTGMNGYQELMTDPSYTNQIVVMTYPEIGNYGFNREDLESGAPKVKAFIVKELCGKPNNFRSLGTLEEYMEENGIAGLKGVDTRSLTLHIRSKGSMRGMILPLNENRDWSSPDIVKKMRELDNPVESVTTKVVYRRGDRSGIPLAVWDFGIKEGILRELEKRGFHLTVYPSKTKAEEILSTEPRGILLSNGPGDPKDLPEVVIELKKVVRSKIPVMGICLGHQLLTLAYGGETMKLPFGHRGGNHPVKDLKTGKVTITSQNHSYTVDPAKLPKSLAVTHINLNDGSIEGLCHRSDPVFSVQYHPEASPGPMDSNRMFDLFFDMIENKEVRICQ